MILSDVISKSYYGSVGYIENEDGIYRLEQYILYNLSILNKFKGIITSTTYKEYDNDLHQLLENTWKKYFPNSVHFNLGKSKGHQVGAVDNDSTIINYCKLNNIEWLCKSANDIILDPNVLNKQIEEADFYYLNGIGFSSWQECNFDYTVYKNQWYSFYPQTNFYFINVLKIDELISTNELDEAYLVVSKSNYNGNIQSYIEEFCCERILRKCVLKNNLIKHHLINENQFQKLLKFIKDYHVHDPSHKNILIEGICHFHHNNNEIISI